MEPGVFVILYDPKCIKSLTYTLSCMELRVKTKHSKYLGIPSSQMDPKYSGSK